MVQQLYTPFLSQAGAAIGQGLAMRGQRQREKERNKLIQSAYMDQPGALQELYAVDPQAAAQVESQKRQKEQTTLSAEAKKRQVLQENKQLVDETLKQAAKLDTVEEAQSFIDQTVERNRELLGDVKFDNLTPEMFQSIKKIYAPTKGVEGKQVQSSKQLPGGLVQVVYRDGTVELVEPKEAEQTLIKSAEVRGAELQGLRAGERGAASEAIKQSIDAFKQLTPVRNSISFLDQGIKLIDEGAETGPIAAKLPSVKNASIKLDQLQSEMGLDVIQNTTFGSLSESELAFALDTALPKKLEGEDLKRWMREKRDAQRKLSDYLTEAAIFLGTPGNTVADFLKMKKEEGKGEQETSEKPMEETTSKTPPTITSDAEYEALPPGTEFIAPDGSRRRKP